MANMLKTLFLITLLTNAQAATAQVAKHPCAPPPKPGYMETNEQVSAWMQKVGTYQTCLQDYSAKHQKLSQAHAAAANAATQEWNAYAKQLNAESAARTAKKFKQ